MNGIIRRIRAESLSLLMQKRSVLWLFRESLVKFWQFLHLMVNILLGILILLNPNLKWSISLKIMVQSDNDDYHLNVNKNELIFSFLQSLLMLMSKIDNENKRKGLLILEWCLNKLNSKNPIDNIAVVLEILSYTTNRLIFIWKKKKYFLCCWYESKIKLSIKANIEVIKKLYINQIGRIQMCKLFVWLLQWWRFKKSISKNFY